MDDFTIRTKIIPKEYIQTMYIGMYKKPFVIIITLIGLFLITTVVLDHFHQINFYTERPTVEIGLGLFCLLIPSITIFQALKQIRSNKNLRDFITYTFGETGITAQAITYKAEFLWEHIIKQRELGKYLILYPNKAGGYFIEKSALTTDQLNFIKSKVKQPL